MSRRLLLVAASIAFMAWGAPAAQAAHCDSYPPEPIGQQLVDAGYTCHMISNTVFRYDKRIGICSNGQARYHNIVFHLQCRERRPCTWNRVEYNACG